MLIRVISDRIFHFRIEVVLNDLVLFILIRQFVYLVESLLFSAVYQVRYFGSTFEVRNDLVVSIVCIIEPGEDCYSMEM